MCRGFALLPTCFLPSLLISCVFAGCPQGKQPGSRSRSGARTEHTQTPSPLWAGRGPRGLSEAALAPADGGSLMAPLFHAEHLPRPRPLQRPCRRQGIPPVAGEEQVSAGGHRGVAWAGFASHPCREHPFSKAWCHCTGDLSPEHFFPSLPNPPGGSQSPQSPKRGRC